MAKDGSYRLLHGLVALTVLVHVCLLLADDAQAEGRSALVIGNRDYDNIVDLNNSERDARGVAEKLRELGFDVQLHIDISEREFEQAIRDYGLARKRGDVSLFYYAGHAIQYEGENYLVPTDAELATVSDVELQLVRLGTVLAEVQERGDVRLIFLDACRNNPFERLQAITRALPKQGLSAIRAEQNSFIAFATEPGNVAYDGYAGDHSPFTGSLVDHMDDAGLELNHLMNRVRDQVLRITEGRQVPWDQSSLLGEFYFMPGEGDERLDLGQELAELNAILRLEDVDAQIERLQTFRRDYPDSSLVRVAQKTIESLESLRPGHQGQAGPAGPNQPPVLAAIPELVVEAGSGARSLSIPPPRDPDQDRLEVEVQEVPFSGTLRQAGRQIKVGDRLSVEKLLSGRYHPPHDYVGSAGQFTFRVHDGRGGSMVGAMMVRVLTPNHPPTFEPPETLVATLGPAPIVVDHVAPEDPDPHDSVVVEIRKAPKRGRLTLSGFEINTGEVLTAKQYTDIRYLPPAEFSNEPDVIELVAGDGRLETVRRVKIRFNRPPDFGEDATAQIISDGAAKPLRIVPPVDPDGDDLEVTIEAFPRDGGHLSLGRRALGQSDTLTSQEVAALAFKPEPDFSGAAGEILLKAVDPFGGSARKTIRIKIERANQPPTLREPKRQLTAVAEESTPLNLFPPRDRDGDELKVIVIEIDQGCRLFLRDRELAVGDALDASDVIDLAVVAERDKVGQTLSITYGVDDQHGGWTAGRVDVEIQAPNRPPNVPSNEMLTFRADEAPVVLLQSDPPNDPDGDPLTVTVLDVPLGSIYRDRIKIGRGDRIDVDDLMKVVYEPPAGFDGFPGTFRYVVEDSRGASVQGSANIMVKPANRPPWGGNITLFEIEGGSEPKALRLDPPYDPDEDVLEIEITELPDIQGLTISLADADADLGLGDRLAVADLSRLFVHAALESVGSRGALRFEVRDNRGGKAEGGRDIEVTAPANHPPVVRIPPKLRVVKGGGPQDLNLIEPTDPEQGPLTVRLVDLPRDGVLQLHGVSLEPGTEIAGTDFDELQFDPGDQLSEVIVWLKFLVIDGMQASTGGDVPIFVEVPPNRPPAIVSQPAIDAIIGIGPVPLPIEPPVDPDNDQLIIRVLGIPESGRLTFGRRDARVGSELSLDAFLDARFTPDALPGNQAGEQIGRPRIDTDGTLSSLLFTADDGRGGTSQGEIEIRATFHDCDRLASTPEHADSVAPAIAFEAIDTTSAVEACTRALGDFGGLVRFRVQLARAYHAASRVEEAKRVYLEAANSGDLVAQHNLAVLLLTEEDDDKLTKKNKELAIRLLTMASEAGLIAAQRSLGLALLETDRETAVHWLDQVSQAGDAEAKTALAMAYYREGDPRRRPTATADLLKQAIALGHVPAATNLGYVYASGLDGSPDLATAAKWFEKAAIQGDIRGAINLARLDRLDPELTPPSSIVTALLTAIVCKGVDDEKLHAASIKQLMSMPERSVAGAIRARLRDLGLDVDDNSSLKATRKILLEHRADLGLSGQAELSAQTLLGLSGCPGDVLGGVQP